MIDIISESAERQLVHHYCLLTQNNRYDLSIAFSNHFYGKSMVTSLQSSKMALLCLEDIDSEHYWAPKLGIAEEDILEIQNFFSMVLQSRHICEL
ncbi:MULTISPECIES: SAV0927 family protein [unclassified Bacillus (in: firmicutes)]|uniref:SAV0927 family protein n=1 Tax=unclassified Bacillus (in: firmicutes) TaxID=185979 RepID=UPI000BEFAB07|nr:MULTISPECIES: SAV0927 family protein [unclassified Bacillus (in: firmicutes)]PEJ59591.1 protein dltD precursor [Bacillus sp. AFS002410]PEL13656.1 protein dltD precursor [Bacillus sp. AFS017336]